MFQFAEEGLTLWVESSELSKTLHWCERLINSIMNLCVLHFLRESVLRQSPARGIVICLYVERMLIILVAAHAVMVTMTYAKIHCIISLLYIHVGA